MIVNVALREALLVMVAVVISVIGYDNGHFLKYGPFPGLIVEFIFPWLIVFITIDNYFWQWWQEIGKKKEEDTYTVPFIVP